MSNPTKHESSKDRMTDGVWEEKTMMNQQKEDMWVMGKGMHKRMNEIMNKRDRL